jgi:hypothetical protein
MIVEDVMDVQPPAASPSELMPATAFVPAAGRTSPAGADGALSVGGASAGVAGAANA